MQVKVSAAVTTTNRAMSEVATDYGIAWWTVHRILVKAVADVLGQATPTSKIGIDETRARSVRWLQQEAENKLTWRRSDPWMTSIVDLDRSHLGGIIDLAAGRSGACVQGWIALQSRQFHAAVQVVAIDPSAPYAAALRRALPHARIVLDHFHLVMLGNQMVTDVRQRSLREQQGRRGMKVDPAWAHRRLLLRGGARLGPKALSRLKTVLASDQRITLRQQHQQLLSRGNRWHSRNRRIDQEKHLPAGEVAVRTGAASRNSDQDQRAAP